MESFLKKPQRFGVGATVTLLILLCFANGHSQPGNEPLEFALDRRVNAHGDEFNGLAKSPDGRFAYIGTEKGEVIVWNLATAHAERTLRQPSPIHHVCGLSDRYVVTAGSNHHLPRNTLVRKWNVVDGTFKDLPGLPVDSFPTALFCSERTGLIAVGVEGSITVWEANTNKTLATVKVTSIPIAAAIIGRDVYFAGIGRDSLRAAREPNENSIEYFNLDDLVVKEFLKKAGHYWFALEVSPHDELLATVIEGGASTRAILFDVKSKSAISSLEGSQFSWIDSAHVLAFKWMDPTEIFEIDREKKTVVSRKLGSMENDRDGRAFDLSGQITRADGLRAWATYRKGPGFLEFDLNTRKIKTLIDGRSGAYAISVLSNNGKDGLLATAGADGYVRLWNLSDLALIKEYHVAPQDSFTTDVDLLSDGKRAVVGVLRIVKTREEQFARAIEVFLVDLTNGSQKKLFEMAPTSKASVINDSVMYPSGDRVKLVSVDSNKVIREFIVGRPIVRTALSENNQWLAVLDEANTLTVFDTATARKMTARPIAADAYEPMVITNDGKHLYQIQHGGELMRWNAQSGRLDKRVLTRIREMHTNVDFITLANDDKWLVTAGNHGDVGIFEVPSGNLVGYTQTTAHVFYAEKAWVKGNRLIFTTDTGIMLDGKLVKSGSH